MSLSVPTSEVAICNLALDRLKQEPVTQIDPATDRVSGICARNYSQVRQAVLRAHTWNFASTRIQISPSGAYTPPFGFSHAYLLPSDWLRYLGRYDSLGFRIPGSENDYEIESYDGVKYYLMNGVDGESINLRYITDFQNVAKMDPLFRKLFILELAIAMAPNFSSGEARVASLMREYKDVKAEATAIDGQERPPHRVQHSKFLASRRRGNNTGASPFTHFEG